jgi:hypothetical protein
VDILDLERACESLRFFLEQCVVPYARAVAVARFVHAVPADLQGRAYYLAEIGPWLSEALRDDAYVCWEPEHARLIATAVDALEDAEVFTATEAGELRQLAERECLGDPPGRSSEQEPQRDARGAQSLGDGCSRRDESSPAPAAQIAVHVPLVCKLPAGLRPQVTDDYVGLPAVLTVALRVKDPRDDPLTWNNGNALTATTGLRAFHDVAADLRVAAREAMHRLAEMTGRTHEGLGVQAEAFRRIDLERLGFDLSIPEKQMPLAGDSIGLALAVALAGAMAGALNSGRAWRPREDLAWTGTVLPTGEVLQVDRASLATKVRVARAAGLAGIVVPRGMGLLAREIMRRYDWDGEVIEAGNLLEALANGSLMRPWRVPASLASGLRRPILGRTLLACAGAVAIIALVGFLPRILDEFAVHWYPFWRPFPQVSALCLPAVVRPGFRLALPGIRDIAVPPLPGRGIGFAGISDNLEGSLHGRPCLVRGIGQDPEGGHHGLVEIRDLRVNRVVCSRVIETAGTPVEPRHVLPGVHYDVKAGVLADVDQDGRDEIVISCAANPDAMTALQILEQNSSGELICTGSILHQGHLERMLAYDLDGDGRLEVVAAGYHGPSQGMSLLVLRREDFYAPPRDSASAAAVGPWSLDKQPCAGHLVVPLLPGYFEVSGVTHLGELQLGLREGEGPGKLIRVEIGAGVSVSADYLLNIPPDLDVARIDIVVNQRQVDQCQRWVRDGAGTDFSSPELLERWRALFRRRQTIQMGWEPAEAPGSGALSRTHP